jgi:hypothetical protein
MARDLLWQGNHFRVVRSSVAWSGPSHPSVARLFDGAEDFEAVRSELRLSRSCIAPYDPLPEWDRVGTDIEHAEILVHRVTGQAIQSDGDLAALGRETPYPSVFHLLVRISWELSQS